jgi:hypothetical protein
MVRKAKIARNPFGGELPRVLPKRQKEYGFKIAEKVSGPMWLALEVCLVGGRGERS